MQDWHATLDLCFHSTDRETTVLGEKRHSGPLMVQKALYPEGPKISHVSVLHPPSGIAGGDHLAIRINVQERAHALINTPGATRWYKANGKLATQLVSIKVKANAKLDWLPQENILFEDSNALSRTHIELETKACAIGWEITQLGSLCNEGHWRRGRMRFDLKLNLDGRPLWIDVGELHANDPLRESPNGLANFPVVATLWGFGPHLSDSDCERISQALPWHEQIRAGMTHFPKKAGQGLTLIRVLGIHAQEVRELLVEQWARLRPLLLGVPALPLRLWAT